MTPPVKATIAPQAAGNRRGGCAKTRSFELLVLAALRVDALHPLGTAPPNKPERPLLLAYATTPQATAPVTANLRAGRPIALNSYAFQAHQLELPRSAGFTYSVHQRPDAHLTLAYLPALFGRLPTAADTPAHLSFVCLPPTWWIAREAELLRPSLGEHAEDGARAALFAAFLDQRSPLPIANDPRFHLELLRAARGAPWLTTVGTEDNGLAALGFDAPLACSVPAATFATFLADVTRKHLPRSPIHGTTRIGGPRRLLPDALPSARQLVLPLFAA